MAIMGIGGSSGRSSYALARARGRAMADWVRGQVPQPQPCKGLIYANGGIRLFPLEGKQKYLHGGIGREKRPCWLVFEEKGEDKLVHVYEANKSTYLNSFYLVKEGDILDIPEPLEKSDRQKALERGRMIAGWCRGKVSLPEAGEALIRKNGAIELCSVDGAPKKLHGGLGGERRPCWLVFEEKEEDKLVHVYEANKSTYLNSFYLVKEGDILDIPEPLERSDLQRAQEKGRMIAAWYQGKAPLPGAAEGHIRENGVIRLCSIDGEQRRLSGRLGLKRRPCWLVFEEKGEDKLVHVYEANKITYLNSFYLVKEGDILDVPEPLEKSDTQKALERGQRIVGWCQGKAPVPEAGEGLIQKNGAIELFTLEGKPRRLRGGLATEKRPCWLVFEEKGEDKLVHVYEANKTTYLNSFYLVKAGEILDVPEPVERSDKQRALERGQRIVGWCQGKAPVPEAAQGLIGKTGVIQLFRLEGKYKKLMGGLGLKRRPCWLVFEEKDGDKLVHVYEKDKTTYLNSFYLVRNGELMQKPEVAPRPVATPELDQDKAANDNGKQYSRHYIPRAEASNGAGSTSGEGSDRVLSPLQKIRQAIGMGDYDGIAAEYRKYLMGMASFWATFARNSLLLSFVEEGRIGPFEVELSLGSGPSTSHVAWSSLSRDIYTIDQDFFWGMLREGENPRKIRNDMADPMPFADGSMDLITIDSAIRYIPEELRYSIFREANRLLKEGGVLSIIQMGVLFNRDFVDPLQTLLGFELLTPPGYRMQLERDFRRSLSASYPAKVVQRIAGILKNCGAVIAVKRGDALPQPESLPQFVLERARKRNGKEHSNGDQIVGPVEGNGIFLGDYEGLLRSRLGIKVVDLEEYERRQKELEAELLKDISDKEMLARMIAIVLEYSPVGSLLEIARNDNKLSSFNQEISEYGFELILTQAGRKMEHAQLVRTAS